MTRPGDVLDRTPTVLIHLGSRAPSHLRICAAQIAAVSGMQPLIVDRRKGARYRGAKLKQFRKQESLSDMGLKRFWRYTCERFFVLEELMLELDLDRCIHVESDVLMYLPSGSLVPWLSDVYGAGVAVCPLTATEDVAAVMYVGSFGALARMNDALLELVEMGPAMLEVHGGDFGNEMRMLHILRTELSLCEALPTTIERALVLGSPWVFDPASYGQYLDGTPGQPGVSYAGDHHEPGRELMRGSCELIWDARARRPFLRSRDAETLWPLANLHVHSKRLAEWSAVAPGR
jgi:hypothetical protein